jgi:DNA helicase-2/ATP-dependent DNA helicase PcrA
VPITSNELALLFEERDRARTQLTPKLPIRLSVSRLVKLLADPQEFFQELARPMPPSYSESAALGTAFHAYLESFLGEGELPAVDDSFAELVQNFENSKFRDQRPVLVEQAIEFSLEDLVVVCKLDAVFKTGDQYEVVDWKSGAVPDDALLQARKIQLALYRIALSKWLNVPIERIRASFFYAADGREISPVDLPSEQALVEMIRQAKTVRLS